jgi:hypothetical protein
MGVTIMVLVGCAIWTLLLAVYRMFFSPIAKIPGPRLAALTGWYEAYYELVLSFGGQYTFKIKELHEQYGPVSTLLSWKKSTT